MVQTASHEGFEYEGPDYSVGIFGAGWTHAECPLDLDEYQDCQEEEIASRHEGTGWKRHVITTYKITCKDCGASIEVEDIDYDPEELDDYEVNDA